jgi:hypothetical protein
MKMKNSKGENLKEGDMWECEFESETKKECSAFLLTLTNIRRKKKFESRRSLTNQGLSGQA